MTDRNLKEIPRAIEKMCASEVFRSAPQLQRLLRFLVEGTLAGHHLKESLIGIQVFARNPSYDPKADSVVRTEVRRLRLKLAAYYVQAGKDDPVRIEIPRGGYSVQFHFDESPAPEPRPRLSGSVAAAAALAIIVSLGSFKSNPDHLPRQSISIAILPFHDLQKNDAEAADLTELATASLSRIPGLRVIAPASVRRVKDDGDFERIASILRVNYVVTGEVAKGEGAFRVRAEILAEPGNHHLAAEEFVGADLNRVSEQITSLVSRVAGSSPPQSIATTTGKPEAEELCRRGRLYWRLRTKENLWAAIRMFDAAAAIDPKYVWPFIGIADSYSQMVSNSAIPPGQGLPKAEAAALHAVALAPGLAEAHASLGLVRYCQWDWREADEEYSAARQLNPNLSIVLFRSAIVETAFGRFDQALDTLRQAEVVDPFSTLAQGAISEIYYYKRDYTKAAQAARDWASVNPAGYRSFLWKPLIRMGRIEEARQELEKLIQTSHMPAEEVRLSRLNFGAIAHSLEAAAEFHNLLREGGHIDSHWVLAQLYAGFRERDAALHELSRALEAREPDLISVQWDPLFDEIRDLPEYQRLLAGMNLAGRRQAAFFRGYSANLADLIR